MKILLMSSRPRVLYNVGVYINFAKFTGKKTAPEYFFNEVVGRRPQAFNFIKKEIPAQVEFAKFEEHLFKRTAVDDWSWIYQYINCHKVSVSELVISKSYKEAGLRGKTKLFLHTHINYQRCPLVKRLFKPCY